MEKSYLYLTIIMLSLNIFSSTVMASEKDTTAIATTSKEMPAEVKNMLNRLEEIKEMDKSNLSPSEKKELRKEVKTIKANLKATRHGVYLSVGAIIIIILLLILLL